MNAMKNSKWLVAHVLAWAISISAASAQDREAPRSASPSITNEDFARADKFLFGTRQSSILNADIKFQWIDGGNAFIYRQQSPNGDQYIRVESATGRRSPLFDHQTMADALGAALGKSLDARHLPVESLEPAGSHRYLVRARGATFDCHLVEKACLSRGAGYAPKENTSPTGQHALFERDYNIWLKDLPSGLARPITTDGVRSWSYGRDPESSRTEISNRRTGNWPPIRAVWSPDGRRFVSYRLDERHVPEIALLQSVPEDGSFRPKVQTYHYDLPGDKGAEAAFFVYDLDTGRRTPIDYPALLSTSKVPLEMGHVFWGADGAKLYLLDAPLFRPSMKLLEIDPNTGKVRQILEERADTTYFPNLERFSTPNVRVLKNGDVIWYSERDGWGHLYLYDGKSGRLKNQLTRGEWVVRDIQRVDEMAGYIYFTASGRERGEDVYNRHLYRVTLNGRVELLTPEPGDHDFAPSVGVAREDNPKAPMSPNGRFVIDHFSTVSAPGRWVLKRSDGTVISTLEREDPSPLPPFTAPEPFVVKSADGRYDLYGVLLKPANFDPTKRYPVIEEIYPGPQSFSVPKSFARALLGEAQALADLGFLVVQVDGRGTAMRSKAFRDASYGRMETAGTLEDHVFAIRELAKSRPWMDLDRVGIYGSSGGGFATGHAMIDYPDFYKVGVASAGNHEQRAYYRIWGETWHGPIETMNYGKVFAGSDVSKFKGKLLLAHGDMDDNVHPAQTLRLADALIKAGKRFDMLIMPNVNHRIGAVPYFRRLNQLYFLEHLMGATLPPEVKLSK